MKPFPCKKVTDWLDSQEILDLYISSITLAEINYGLESLPKGKRRSFLEEAFKKAIIEVFACRILTFDEHAAFSYGHIMAKRKELGKPMSILDGQIAAIAVSQQAAIATRNISDFTNCDLSLIDPFL